MNENNQLEPGETIIVMRNASGGRGKTIKGTRVFNSFHAFQDYVVKNCLIDSCNKPVGTVINTSNWGGNPKDLVVTKQGYMLGSLNAFIASEDKDPKRLKVTHKMLGVPEGMFEWRDKV